MNQLYVWDMGLWDNWDDEVLERIEVVASSHKRAKELLEKYRYENYNINDYPTDRIEYDFNESDSREPTPGKYYDYEKEGVY